MKKIIAIIAFISCLIFCSCEKLIVAYSDSDTVEVSFSTSVISGYIPTRGFADEVLDNLPYVEPPIQIYNPNTKETITLDLSVCNTVSLAKGTYYISATAGSFYGTKVKSQTCVPLVAALDNPKINNVSKPFFKAIEITEAKNYNIELQMAGFVVACPKDQASYLKYEHICDSADEGKNLMGDNLLETQNYYYYIIALSQEVLTTGNLYCNVGFQTGELGNYAKTYKKIYASAHIEKYRVLGKYFIFNPKAQEVNEFGVTIPNNWENGGSI